MPEEIDIKIRELELNYAKMAEAMLDLRERIDSHKEYCGLPEYKANIDKTLEQMNNRANTIVGIIATIFFVYFSALSFLHLSKVNTTDFENKITEFKQEEIRRDERIQVLTEQQQQLQIELLKEVNEVKIEVTKLTRNMK